MGVLEEELGGKMTDESKEAWRKGLEIMSEAVANKKTK